MPKLNDHGLGGGGGKALGVPVFPFSNNTEIFVEDLENYETFNKVYGDATGEAPVNFNSNAHCVIGDEIFIFGTSNTIAECYKYNVKTKVWTKLSNSINTSKIDWMVPDKLNGNISIYYGEVGGTIYKYTISSNTHTFILDTSSYHKFKNSKAVYNNAHIWTSGGNYASNQNNLFYSFSLRTNGFTKRTNLPIGMVQHGMVSHGDSIYFFGGTAYGQRAYRYDVSTATFTQLTNIPDPYYEGPCISDDNFIYLINSAYDSANDNRIWIYDIVANTYTVHAEGGTNVNRSNGHAGIIDDLIYVIGGTNGPKTGYSMRLLAGKLKQALLIRLFKNTKLYTDGDVSLNDESLVKSNGVVNIPSDGEYLLVDASYATIGG